MRREKKDVLKYVEEVMNQDHFFHEIKMVLSAGYVAAYVFMERGEKAKAREVAKILGDLGRECSPLLARTMGLIRKCYQGERLS